MDVCDMMIRRKMRYDDLRLPVLGFKLCGTGKQQN